MHTAKFNRIYDTEKCAGAFEDVLKKLRATSAAFISARVDENTLEILGRPITAASYYLKAKRRDFLSRFDDNSGADFSSIEAIINNSNLPAMLAKYASSAAYSLIGDVSENYSYFRIQGRLQYAARNFDLADFICIPGITREARNVHSRVQRAFRTDKKTTVIIDTRSYMENASWISPCGILYEVPATHIEFLTDNSSLFGLNYEQIMAAYHKYNEKPGLEGKARGEIMEMVIKNGWTRIRKKKNFWTIETYSLDKQTRAGIKKWLLENKEALGPYSEINVTELSSGLSTKLSG